MKSKKIVFAILAAIFLTAIGLRTFGFASTPKEDSIKMEITYGYNGNVKWGRYIPIKFSLENFGEDKFAGILQVIAKQSAEENYLYEREVSLESQEQAEFEVVIPLSADSNQLYVKLLDRNGSIVKEELLKLKTSRDNGQLFIGILADNYEDLTYFNNYRLNDGELSVKTFHLMSEDVPESAVSMNLLDLIIINDFNTSRLTKRQISAMEDWVHDGGTLLIGTGNSVEKTLSGFGDHFFDVEFYEAETLTTDLGVAHTIGETEKNYIDITYRELSVKYGKTIFKEGSRPLMIKQTNERGIIGFAGFDLTELSEYCGDNTTYVNTMITELMSKKRLSKIAEESVFGDYNKYWSVNAMVQAGHTEHLPNADKYAVVLIIYVILASPILYLLLKKSDKRQYYQLAVIVLSAGCSFFIYILGQETRFQTTFFNYVTIKEMDADYENETTYMNVRAPYNDKYSVNINPSYFVVPIAKNSYYYSYNEEDMNGEEKYNVSLNRGGEDFTITVQNVVSFTSELFQLNRKNESDVGKKLLCEVQVFDGELYGTISNHLGYDLEKAAIIMYGQVIILGDLKDGETIGLENLKVTMYPLNYTYDIAKTITGNHMFEKPDPASEEYSLSFQRANLLQYYIVNYFPTSTMEAKVIAFTKDKNEKAFLLDAESPPHLRSAESDEYDTYGITMIAVPVEVNYHRDGMIYYPRLPEEPQIISGDYQAESNTAYGQEPIILEYPLGKELDIEKISLTVIDEKMAYSYYLPFSGDVYFWNQETNEFDKKTIENREFEREELESYLSGNNSLTIKYEPKADAEYQWDINLPILSVVGREKDAEN